MSERIERYDICVEGGFATMEPRPSGGYVKHGDHAAALEAATTRAEELEREKAETVEAAMGVICGHRCNAHTGVNTPPFAEFSKALDGRCHLCDAEGAKRAEAAEAKLQKIRNVVEHYDAFRLSNTRFRSEIGRLVTDAGDRKS